MSYCLPKLTFHCADRREHILHEPRGILAHLDAAASRWASLHEPADIHSLEEGTTIEKIAVEAAARWLPAGRPNIESYANIHRTTEGGTHTRGLLLELVCGPQASRAPQVCLHHPTETSRARRFHAG